MTRMPPKMDEISVVTLPSRTGILYQRLVYTYGRYGTLQSREKRMYSPMAAFHWINCGLALTAGYVRLQLLSYIHTYLRYAICSGWANQVRLQQSCRLQYDIYGFFLTEQRPSIMFKRLGTHSSDNIAHAASI